MDACCSASIAALSHALAVATLCALAAGAVNAQAIDDESATAPPDNPAPRLTRVQVSADASLLRANAAAAGASTQLVGVSYRWWISHGRSDVGVGVGTLGYRVTPIGALADDPRIRTGATPMLSVGWRYRVSDQSVLHADALSARGLAVNGGDGYFTKIGVEWKAKPESRFGLDGSSLGLQFDSGLRMSIRLKKGGVGFYLRSKF